MALATRPAFFGPAATLWSSLVAATVDLVRPGLRRLRARQRWIAVEEGGDLVFHRVSARRAARVGAAAEMAEKDWQKLRTASGGHVELRLLPERVIEKSLTLPGGGRHYVEPIIEHRLERLTPWRPEKVLYGFAMPSSAKPDGTIDVSFAATSQEIADKSRARLAAHGLTASAIGSAAQPIEDDLAVDLLRGQADVGERRLRKVVSRLALAVLVSSACFYIVSAFLAAGAEDRRAHVETALAEARRALFEGGGDARRQRDLALIDGKTPQTALFPFLERLATVVPDDTYLTQISIQPSGISLAGVSDNAPDLIRIFQDDGTLANARFSAPITRDADNRDRFEIAAERASPADPDAAEPEPNP